MLIENQIHFQEKLQWKTQNIKKLLILKKIIGEYL